MSEQPQLPASNEVGMEPVESFLDFTVPSAEARDKLCEDMHQSLPPAKEADWQGKVERVLVEQSRERAKLQRASRQQTSVVGTVSRMLYKLHLFEDRTPVLVAAPSSRDVQTVYEKPSYDSKKLGVEQRSVIEVAEAKDGWLRYYPRADDRGQQCWVAQSSGNGRWELSPEQSSTALQLEFFVESSLEMLMFALAKEQELSKLLLECCRRFAGRLPPLALFESAGTIIEKSIDALIRWLTERVATASAACTADVVTILVQLTLARGSLSAIMQFAVFLSSRPDLLTPELLTELDKLSEIQNFETAARVLFQPPPGSLEHFAAEWKEHVIPAVRHSGQVDAEIMTKVREGDGEAALDIVRAVLNEKTFAALWVPNLHRLRDSQDAKRFAASLKQLHEARHRAGHASAVAELDILVLVFSHVELVSIRVDASARARAPICVDVQAIEHLVELLSSHCPVDGLFDDGSEATARRDLCVCLLRLLGLNVSRMVASRAGPLSESCAATLQKMLTNILALDSTKQSECAKIVEAAAQLFGVSQQFLLRSASAKISAVKDLVAKLLAPTPGAVTTATLTLEPEQPETGKLLPCTVEVPAAMKGCNVDISTQGLIRVPAQDSAQMGRIFLSTTTLSGGTKHYLEIRLADSSPTKPSIACPQALDLVVGVIPSVVACGPLEQFPAHITAFHPVKGDVVVHGVERGAQNFIGNEWWKSSKSSCAGDTVGLCLDTATGELIALKNRKPIGTIRSPDEQQAEAASAEARWVIMTNPSGGLHIEVSHAVIRSLDEIAGLVRNDPPAHLDAGTVVERLAAAVVSETAKATALMAMLPEEGSIDLLGSLVDLLTYNALGGHRDSSFPAAATQAKAASWSWDESKKHSSFEISSAGAVARRTSGSRPDYAGIFGTQGFDTGVHEWDVKFDQRCDRVWAGVATEEFPLENGDTPDCVSAARGHIWYFRDNGEYGQNSQSSRRGDFRMSTGGTYRFKLDCDEGTFSLYKQGRSSGVFELAKTIAGINGTVFPIMYFDYETKVALLEARSELPESDGPVGTTLTQSLLSSTVIRAMRLLSDQSAPPDVSRAVAVVQRVFNCAQKIFVAIRESAVPKDVTPFQMLEHCNLRELLSGAIALASTVNAMRMADGSTAALVLTDLIVGILTEIQATVDSCRDVLVDPSKAVQVLIKEFSATHSCDAVTAAFYIHAFGDQAKAEYDRSGFKPAPNGYMIPVDEHWLIDVVDVISSCGGKCIATLCSGLKSFEDDFDLNLFTAECEAGVVASVLERLDVESVRQNWRGFSAPVLQQVEEVSIKAMIAHCGLLHHDDSVEHQGALLHVGREALRIKSACQDRYRQSRNTAPKKSSDSAESPTPLTWEDAAEGFLERARLILNYSGAATLLSEPTTMKLRREEQVFDWERDNANKSSLCKHVDKIRRFIQSDVVPSRVVEVLQSRRTSVPEAEAGYRYAVELLTAGETHRHGLERSYTVSAINVGNHQTQNKISGNWHAAIESTDADGKTTHTESDYELCCVDQWIFGSCVPGVEVCGRVVVDTNRSDEHLVLEWTEIKCEGEKRRVVRRFEVCVNAAEKTLAGTGTTAEETPKTLKISGQLKRPGMVPSKVFSSGADGRSTTHPILRGISLSQRQCGLLQSASKAFAELGPLSEASVQDSSDNLSRVVLSLLCSGSSVPIREAAGRMLLTRLDDGGARFLAAADATRLVLVNAAAETSDETSSLQDVQSIFIATLLVKVARLSPVDDAVLTTFVGAVLETMRNCVNQTHTLRCMESLRAACHEPCIISELQKEVNVEFFWAIVHQRPAEGATLRASNVDTKLHVGSVQNVRKVISTVRSTLGDICSTWDRAGWEGNDEFERTVQEHLEKDPTFSEPCIVARDLSVEMANELVAALQSNRFLEDDENLLCERQENRVVLFLRGTKPEEEMNEGPFARIQLAALQLLHMSLRPSDDALLRTLRFIETVSPESQFVAESNSDRLSLPLRVHASMMLRNLLSSRGAWADLFCDSLEQAAAATAGRLSQLLAAKAGRSVVPVFAHLTVLGVPEVSGCGQPDGASGSIDYTLQRSAKMLQGLLQQVLATSHSNSLASSSSISFCILRARLLKVAFEVSLQAPGIGIVNSTNIAAMLQLALEPVEAPASVVVEALVTKLHTLYPLCAECPSPEVYLKSIATSGTEPEPESEPPEGVPPDNLSRSRSSGVMSLTQLHEQVRNLRAQGHDSTLPKTLRTLDLPMEGLLDEQTDDTEMAVGYSSEGSVEKAISAAEHDLAVLFARLCMFATRDGQTSCADTLQIQSLVETASTLFLSGHEVMNPLILTRSCLSPTVVEQMLLSRTAADADESTGLRLLMLSRLCRPLDPKAQKATVSSDSLEQLKHNFTEFCRAAGLMSHYKVLTQLLTTTGAPAGCSSVDAEPVSTFCVGELCQVEVQPGTAKAKWIYGRVSSDSDRADTLNVFIFPDNSIPGTHTRVHFKHLRKCTVPTVQGLRALRAEDLAGVVEASNVEVLLNQIASVPKDWEAPDPTSVLFSSTNKSRSDLREGGCSFRAPRHVQAGGVASEQQIKDSGVLVWRLKLVDCDSELAIVVGAADVRSFDDCFRKGRAAPRRAEWAVTNSSMLERAHGAKRVTEKFKVNTVLRIELDLDCSPTKLTVMMESDGGHRLLLEKNDISTEHDKALFFGYVHSGGSIVRVDALPLVLRSYNMEPNEADQRSERTIRASPSRPDAHFHLWLAQICVNMEERNSGEGSLEWMEILAERLLVIWVHGELRTQQMAVAVLARMPSSCLCTVLAREPEIQKLFGESIGRQWKIAHREQRVLLPSYVQALLEVAYKAGLLTLHPPGSVIMSGSLAMQAMLSVIEPATVQLLPETASDGASSGLHVDASVDAAPVPNDQELSAELAELEASSDGNEAGGSATVPDSSVAEQAETSASRTRQSSPHRFSTLLRQVARLRADNETGGGSGVSQEGDAEAELEPEPEIEPEPQPEPQPETQAEPAPQPEGETQPEPEVPPAQPQPDPDIVAALQELGFPRNACRRAAVATNNAGVQEGLEWCFAHVSDPDYNDPLSEPESLGSPGLARTLSRTQIELLASDIVHWEWQSDRAWHRYSDEHSRILEDAWAESRPEADLGGRHGWVVDMHAMEQRNTSSTGNTRAVRRTVALPFAEPGSFGLELVEHDDAGRPATGGASTNVLVVESVGSNSEAERVSRAAGISLQGMILHEVGGTPVHNVLSAVQLSMSAARPVTLVFGPNAAGATQVMNCPGEHGLSVGRCSHAGFSCDVCTSEIGTGSEMLSCRRCDFDVCSSCAEASRARARSTTAAAQEFRAAIKSYSICHELLAPGLPMPPAPWWELRRPGWTKMPTVSDLVAMDDSELLVRAKTAGVDADKMTDETLSSVEDSKEYLANLIVERATLKYDFSAAFSESTWSIEMDTALVAFLQERAIVKKKSVAALTADDLFDELQTTMTQPGSPTGTARSLAVQSDGESTPDKAALFRNVSMAAPEFAQKLRQDSMLTSPRRPKPVTHLADNSEAAIRARFVLLREWNEAVRPALPLIDLHLFESVGHISRQLCIGKGRLLPDMKNQLIERALKLSASSENIPRVSLDISGPGVLVRFSESVFGQIFNQLHGKHPMTNVKMNEAGEGQLWKLTSMQGEGALAFTDSTDVGGHFRTSLRLLCNDLTTVPLSKSRFQGQVKQPLFIPTPNYAHGVGTGAEAAGERYLPNPSFTTKADLEKYKFVGALCGAAARFTGFMELELASLCWKTILDQTLDLHEIQLVDMPTASYLELVLSIETEDDWHLLQDGEHPVRWCVRLANNQGLALRGDGTALVEFGERAAYCAAAGTAYLDQFKPQLAALAAGFYQVFPKVATRLLTWRELERRVCGLPDVDVSQLQRIAQFEGTYSESDEYIQTFWQVLRELSGQERKQLLGFVWGRSRLPANCETPFVIDSSSMGDGDGQLPTSHTCMFQLHLPRYSSATVLKERLLTAIQNAGQRGDADGALASSKTGGYLEPDGITVTTGEEARSACLFKLPSDGGHLETLLDFCQRARVDHKEIQRCLAVNNMSQVLAMDLDFVRAALDQCRVSDGASYVGEKDTASVATSQRTRNRYEAMTLSQLKRCCQDSWLSSEGLKSDLVERLVAYDDAVSDGNEPALADPASAATQSPLQKADVARVMTALAQAQRCWRADPLGGDGSATTTLLRPPVARSAVAGSDSESITSEDLFSGHDELEAMLRRLRS